MNKYYVLSAFFLIIGKSLLFQVGIFKLNQFSARGKTKKLVFINFFCLRRLSESVQRSYIFTGIIMCEREKLTVRDRSTNCAVYRDAITVLRGRFPFELF